MPDPTPKPPEPSYTAITAKVKELVAKIPDEGNKSDICLRLSASFMTAAYSTADLKTITTELRDRNDNILGFRSAVPSLNDESVWFDLLKDRGYLSNYLDENKIVVDSSNYKQLFTAIAQGLKESI